MITPRSEHPFRKCLDCESIRECPEPEILQDGWGTAIYNGECPKKDLIIETCNQRAKEYYERTK